MDVGLADVNSKYPVSVDDQLVVGGAPCVLKAAGEYYPREAGTQSELQARDFVSSQHFWWRRQALRGVGVIACNAVNMVISSARLAEMTKVSLLLRYMGCSRRMV